MSLYTPYKAIGYVCDSNPFVINRLGEEIFLTMSIGSCFQVFRFNKLISCLISKTAPGKISSMQAFGQDTIVATNSSIVVYDRSNIVRTYDVHSSPILGMISIGNNLISFDTENNIKITDVKSRRLVGELQLLQRSSISALIHPTTYVNKILVGFANGELELWNINKKALIYSFSCHLSVQTNSEERPAITCIEQSPACDVVALGFSSGDILLVNLKLDQVLFSFVQEGGAVTSLSFRTDAQSDRSPYMVSSSADGRIHVWNLGSGDSDQQDRAEHLGVDATGIQRKLQCSIEDAHVGAVSRVAFLHGEPIMVSTGAADNSVKVWIFDSPDGSARLLRSREGHSGSPTRIRYYGGTTNVSMRDNADGMSCELVSAGNDGTLRLFNTAIESQNRELSQKPVLKMLGLQRRNERLPDCIGFDFAETRQRDWGNMVSIHQNHVNAYVWRFRHRVVTDMVLRQPSWASNDRKFAADRRNHATAVTMSPCGNFCVVGYKGGAVFKYNVQSGKSRGAYPKSGSSDMKKGLAEQRAKIPGNVLHDARMMAEESMVSSAGLAVPTAQPQQAAVGGGSTPGHVLAVTGMCVDMTNTTLATCGLDGRLVFWDFNTHEILHEVLLTTPLLLMQGFRDGNFVAVAGQDRVVRVYDMHTFKLSRRFDGHSQEITDLAFTPDGRRLLSSSGDSTLRVWDMPTSRCLCWLKFDSPILSMAVSLSGEYLCVAQADKEGIYMYIDKSLYETVHFWKEPTSPTPVADSGIQMDQADLAAADPVRDNSCSFFENEPAGVTDAEAEDELLGSVGRAEVTPSQGQVVTDLPREESAQRGGGITMSAIPRAYWTSLFHLETIKKRNKPKAPPAPAPLAPFFLPTIVRGGSTPSFPTPAEYAKLSKSIETAATNPTPAQSALVEDSQAQKRQKLSDSASQQEEAVMAELAQMGSVWADEEPMSGDGWVLDRTASAPVDSAPSDAPTDEAKQPVSSDVTKHARSESRVISRKTSLPRCKLVAYLEQESPVSLPDSSLLLEYLKTLAPPAVDLEIRALCGYEEDEEGLRLLEKWLLWLTVHVSSGDNFEVMQAYLHRTLTVYAELLIKVPQLAHQLNILSAASAVASNRFREILQKNLCLLKMMAKIPVV